jgi:hypothetical protein
MNVIQNFFHALHARELVDEYGLVGGIFIGIVAAVELADFPFWVAVNDLFHGEGKFVFFGTKLRYTAEHWSAPDGNVLGTPVLATETHQIDLLLVLACIVGASILGSIGVSRVRHGRRAAIDSKRG